MVANKPTKTGKRPEDWQPVARLCESVLADLPRLVAGIVDLIRQELPEYRVVDRTEHEHAVTRQYEGLLTGLATRRPPSQEESEAARALGRQRAREGLPLQSMISAYHVGYREMWNVLLTRADADAEDSGLSGQLVRLVGIVWTWIELASSAAADAYGEAIRAEDAAQLSLTHRFLDALSTGAPAGMDLERLAHAVAFDPTGVFQAVCAPAQDWSDEDLSELRGNLRRRRGVVRCANRGTTMIALAQHIPADVVVQAMRRRVPGAPAGVGLAREGLAGAAASIEDAQEVLPLAVETRRVADFGQDWLLAAIRSRAGRLGPLLDHCREPAAAHPELAETVRGFAENGLSLTATGQALHVHANTVKYRLDRWYRLTGWDVRTWSGLSASMVGLGLFAPSTHKRR